MGPSRRKATDALNRISKNVRSRFSKKSFPEQTLSSQDDSPFLTKLPFELRAIVYQYFFSGTLYLNSAGGTVRCGVSPPTAKSSEGGGLTSHTDDLELREPHLLSLLLACKSIHAEAVDFLYQIPLYDLRQYQILTLPKFAKIARLCFHIAFFRFPQLTNNTQNDISMPVWKFICRTLAGLPTLTELTVVIHQSYFFVEQRGTPDKSTLIAGFFEPLKQITLEGRGASFEVHVNWPVLEEADQLLGECAFKLVEIDENDS